MIHINCLKKFHFLEAPITLFVCGCQYCSSWVACWSDAPHLLLKTLHRRRICNGPCISVLSTRSSTSMQRVTSDRQRYPGSSKNGFFVFLWLDRIFFLTYSHSQNVGQIWTEQWQAGVAKLSLWGTHYLLEIENKSEVVFFGNLFINKLTPVLYLATPLSTIHKSCHERRKIKC